MISRFFDDAERDDVDQTIVVEALVEIDVAGDVRNADRVAVRGDAVDHAAARRSVDATARRSVRPKRSGSATAITSAPMQSTSRTMPPMPVAAPSNGTTCEGWLCDSCAIDDAVAFAVVLAQVQDARRLRPGPSTTAGPVVGRLFR